MCLPDLLFARIRTQSEHGVGLLGAHALGPVGAPPAGLYPFARRRAPLAPVGQAPVEIGFHDGGFRRAFLVELGKELHRLAIAERGQRTPREATAEAFALHLAGVVVERDLEPVGLDPRLLPRRLARRAEGIAEAKPASLPEQREAEHRERNGESECAAQDEEPCGGNRRDAAYPAESNSEIAGVG